MAPIIKQTWRDSLPTDMLLSAVSILVFVLPSSEVPERLMNYPVFNLEDRNTVYIVIFNGLY
jgi:hypothetical protein